MHHIAFMKKSWSLTEKILSGEKQIESRWYKTKRTPWNKVNSQDITYFKNSGELVSIKAIVDKVIQFSDLTPHKVKKIFKKYGKQIGIETCARQKYFNMFKDKKYCILIFLKNPKNITPFKIHKKGFGAMTAWISTNNIKKIQY